MNFSALKAIFLIIALATPLFVNAGELDDAYTAFGDSKYELAFPIILKAAQANNPKAQGLAARMYGNGWGVAKDEKEAYLWASKGALKDDAASQAVIGYMYLYGLGGLEKNEMEAIKWYKKSANQNNLRAVDALASIYDDKLDFITQIEYLERSFSLGRVSAAYSLGNIYEAVIKTPDHSKIAVEWFLKGAARGDIKSMQMLAAGYKHGWFGLPKDSQESFRFYELCANKASPECLLRVGTLYMRGDGVAENTSKGMKNIQAAVDAGNEAAMFNLALISLTGLWNVPENPQIGYKLLGELKDRGSYLSANLESLIYERGINRPQNTQKAVLLAIEAAESQKKNNPYSGISSGLGILSNRVSGENFQLPKKYAVAWERYGIGDLKETEYITDYDKKERKTYEENLSKLSSIDKNASESITFSELLRATKDHLESRRAEIGPIEPRDLVDEGWYQFIGKRGEVNEPLAQYLTEEGLRLAIRVKDDEAAGIARNNLGVILTGAANKNVRNSRLGIVHLVDGKDSRFGPSNLLFHYYYGDISLDKKEVTDLSNRYVTIHGKAHPIWSLPPLPENLKKNSTAIAEFLIKVYGDPGNGSAELASEIASIYEDDIMGAPDFGNASEWYLRGEKYAGSIDRYRRAQLIIQGRYEKAMPNFTGTLYSLFEVDLVTTKSGFLTNLKSAISPVQQPKKRNGKLKLYALVIGNSNYNDRPLKNSVNDSRAISTKLKNLGFNVTELENLDRKKFKEAVISFSEKAKDSDVTLLFYSGHGIQLGGINYLLPTDIDFNGSQDVVTYDGFSLNDIRNRNLPGATKLIFLDACRVNPFKSSATRGVSDEGLAPINVSTGTIISFATKDGGVAYDSGSGNNSPYTQSLLKYLDEDEDVEIMLRSVRDNVVKLTQNRQEPWKYGSLSGGKVIISKLAQ